MAAKPLDKMTKPELVKALKAAQKRIAKLEQTAADLQASRDALLPAEDMARDGGPMYDWPAAEDQAPEEPRNVFPWNNDEPESK